MDDIKVTFGKDIAFHKATASQPVRLTSATLKVNGTAPALRKGDTVPTLRLTAAQAAALKAAGAKVIAAGAVTLPGAPGRGRQRSVAAPLADFFDK